MGLGETRGKLMKALTQLEGHKRAHDKAETELLDHASRQLDTLAPVHDTVVEHLEAGKGGGVYGHRYLRTLQTERHRLQNVLARNARTKR